MAVMRMQEGAGGELTQAAEAGQQLVEQAAEGVWARLIQFLEFEVPILDAIAPEGRTIVVANVLMFVVFLVATFMISRLAQAVIGKTMRRRGMDDVGTVGTVQRLAHYTIVVVGILLAIEQLGFDLTAIFAAGAVAAVGIGFALQNILQNFVSGFILLIERSVKPGDTIEVDGMVVKVEEMGIRATIVRNWDDEELIIPNSTLVQSNVKNFTLRDDLHRLRCKVGVAYSSDVEQVREVLLEAARGVEFRNPAKDPVCLLMEFGDSSVNFDVSVWTNDPWVSRINRSHLNFAVWHALKAEGIVIAFPQMDVHLDVVGDARSGRTDRTGRNTDADEA
jgi:small-conductance mechanosensitive channel